MKIAVVGAGPAGFYAANALLSKFPRSCIDILDRLPVPFGLVRYGVAPDHPATRNVITQFSRLMRHNPHRLTFNGNIRVLFPSVSENTPPTTITTPSDTSNVIPFQHLQQVYHVVIMATGAAYPRRLDDDDQRKDIAKPVFSAHDFVLWLNGHPDLHDRNGARPLVAERMMSSLRNASDCTVIGAGNVALDIARNLLRPHSLMSMMKMTENADKNDSDNGNDVHDLGISLSAWNVMSGIDVSNVNVIARRAPHQAAWTTAALRELVSKVPGVRTRCDQNMIKESVEIISKNNPRDRKTKRMLDVLTKHTIDDDEDETIMTSKDASNDKTLRLLFNHKLNRFDGCCSDDDDPTTATSTSNIMRAHFTNGQTVDTDMTFLSLGYVSPHPPSPLHKGDSEAGAAQQTKAKTAAVGWANGTARGIIGDNKWDAETVVAGLDASALTDAAASGRDLPGLKGIIDDMGGTKCTVNKDTIVSWAGWERIRAEEASRGKQLTGLEGRSVRLESVQEMLAVANG